MDYKVELADPKLTNYKLFVNDTLVKEGECISTIKLTVPSSNDTVSIWFEPWEIQPKVRVNNILVNYALAGIDLYNHKLDITLSSTFFEQYHQRDIKYRIQGLFGDCKPDSSVYDAVIGVGNEHKDIVDQIKKALDIE
jgi:hypothetical protein